MNYGIIFDLDGTLWDSSEQVAVSWSEVLSRRPETDRQVTGEDMRGFMGKTMETIAELMLPELEPSLRIEIMHECERVEQEYLEKHGGVLF
ncbi:MAG: HAD hydrolase-like protein, partial [Oscillospiraceae bacterium]|nr:HAD hydrolase-like protein [Oscillospiraceae bacterium]